MAKSDPLVSIIIPVYNGERYLAEAIESVLAQTYQPLEIIVINDGSTDGSEKVAKRFIPSIQYYSQQNKGLAPTRNRGVELAKGTFLAFLDADDVWVEDKLERQMAAFADDSKPDMVFGYVSQFHSPELDKSIKEKIYCPTESMPGYHPGAMLIRRDMFLRVGLFETKWKWGEFVDWYSRAKEQGLKSLLHPEVVMKRRLHTSNMGMLERETQTDYVRALKASLDRRRRNNIPKK